MVEWRARTTSNGFDDFISFFSERDVEVRRLNRMVAGRAAAAGYYSAANVDKINKRINDKVNAEVANFAAAFKAAINTSAFDNSATASLVNNQETAANVADKLTSPSSSNTHDAILATLKTISNRLEKMEKAGGCRRGGRHRDGADNNATTKAAGDRRTPCVNCGKRHRIPDEKCWALDVNKDDRPANYAKPPPGFAKGN